TLNPLSELRRADARRLCPVAPIVGSAGELGPWVMPLPAADLPVPPRRTRPCAIAHRVERAPRRNDVAIEQLTLAYEGLERDDPPDRASGCRPWPRTKGSSIGRRCRLRG